MRPEEQKGLESQLGALETDLQNARHVSLRDRIKQAYGNLAERTEENSKRCEQLVLPYASPAQAMASQELRDAIQSLWIKCVAQRGEAEKSPSLFCDQLTDLARECSKMGHLRCAASPNKRFQVVQSPFFVGKVRSAKQRLF
jgi:hypothetical protein